jgi:hypothetical protein
MERQPDVTVAVVAPPARTQALRMRSAVVGVGLVSGSILGPPRLR